MAYIKFIDSNNLIQCSVVPEGNIVTLKFTGNVVVDTSGFFAFLDPDAEIDIGGDSYLKYTTIYRNDEETARYNGYQLSNDGSVYTPPAPDPEPEPPTPPTEEELKAQFERNKLEKIVQSKDMLQTYLENNPIISSAHGRKMGLYSITKEKQDLMVSQYMTYQIEKTVNPEAKLTWNETGKSCEEWTEAEFMQLILEIKSVVYPLVSKQQAYEEEINACNTQNELNEIIISYGG